MILLCKVYKNVYIANKKKVKLLFKCFFLLAEIAISPKDQFDILSMKI